MNPRNKWLAGSALVAALVSAGLYKLEGSVPKTYLDIANIATVCIGHTGPDVEMGKMYTKDECDTFLKEDLKEHMDAVVNCAHVPLSEKTFAALTMFSFNIGADGFCKSSLVKRFNAGDYVGGCNGLMAWNKAHVNGQIVEVKGLTNRRQYERKLCLDGLQ